jgi:hypothetical protein
LWGRIVNTKHTHRSTVIQTRISPPPSECRHLNFGKATNASYSLSKHTHVNIQKTIHRKFNANMATTSTYFASIECDYNICKC